MKEIYSLTPRDSPTSDSSSVDKKSKDTDSVKDVEGNDCFRMIIDFKI